MNTTFLDPAAPPLLPPQRPCFRCNRHLHEHYIGFCPSCLRERLSTLERSLCPSATIKSVSSSTSEPDLFFPERRRSKSFSASKNEASGSYFEPKRKSCDVRVINYSDHQNHDIDKKIESCVENNPFFKKLTNEEGFRDSGHTEDSPEDDCDRDRIGHVQDSHLKRMMNVTELDWKGCEIVEEGVVSMSNLKPTKDRVDVNKKSWGRGFLAAASIFSKKWHNWRRKQKMKKQSNGENIASLSVQKEMISRQYIADYGFGRTSCDANPRFSLDAGRISFGDPRCSFEEPRASWDGYLIGRSFPRMVPMASVLEDAPNVQASSSMISCTDEDVSVPGGLVQTQEYYLDSSLRRRKSLDRSSVIKKTGASAVAEIDELKVASNSKIFPATAGHSLHAKAVVREGDATDSIWKSLRGDLPETFELRNGCKYGANSVVERKALGTSRKWSWRTWGLRNVPRDGNVEDTCNRVSWRNVNASRAIGALASVKTSDAETKGNGKKRNEFALEKNREF